VLPANAEIFGQPSFVILLSLGFALFIVEAGHSRNTDDGLQAFPSVPLLKRTQYILWHREATAYAHSRHFSAAVTHQHQITLVQVLVIGYAEKVVLRVFQMMYDYDFLHFFSSCILRTQSGQIHPFLVTFQPLLRAMDTALV
jgi:hypothetical protein